LRWMFAPCAKATNTLSSSSSSRETERHTDMHRSVIARVFSLHVRIILG
jgi:hypothetical protein